MSPYDLAKFVYAPLPVLYLLLAACLLWAWPRWRNRILVAATVIFALLAVPATSRLMIVPLETHTTAERIADPVAVVVLTAGILTLDGTRWLPDSVTFERFEAGNRLSRRFGVPLIVSGGRTVAGAPAESRVVLDYAMEKVEGAVAETESVNTWQSARNMVPVLSRWEPGIVIVVTSPEHSRRATAAFRRHGINARVISSGGERYQTNFSWRRMVPSTFGLFLANRAIAEYAATTWYLISGKIRAKDLFQG